MTISFRNHWKRLIAMGLTILFLLLFVAGIRVEGPVSVMSGRCYSLEGTRSPYSVTTYEQRTVLWYRMEMIELHGELRRWPNSMHPQRYGWPHGEMPLKTGSRIHIGQDFPYFGYNDWLERRARVNRRATGG